MGLFFYSFQESSQAASRCKRVGTGQEESRIDKESPSVSVLVTIAKEEVVSVGIQRHVVSSAQEVEVSQGHARRQEVRHLQP